MLQDAQQEMTRHPYLALFPGLAIALTVYAFNMFGDGLRGRARSSPARHEVAPGLSRAPGGRAAC